MENRFIIVVVVALFIVALLQLMKVYDIASMFKGNKFEEKLTRRENSFNAKMLIVSNQMIINLKRIKEDENR